MKNPLRFALFLLAWPALAAEPPTPPARSPEAMEILKKADAAIKAVDAVRYQVSIVPSGVATNFVSAAEGSAVLIGWDGRSQPKKFYAQVKTKRPGKDETVEITGGGDGESYFVVDHGTKKGYEDMDPAVLGSTGRALQAVMVIEFVHDKPFDDELGADKVELVGVEDIAGETCDRIHVVYAGGQGASTWFFSKRDSLPRRRIREIDSPARGKGAIEITLKAIEVAPQVDAALFKMKLPAGYQRVDDFAP
ncbi:MAG TPA: hypothetical protein VJS92_08435 [Candidatus Polarisedimenticolaceae bacterium]|nr:hypothetical protein [Candidatus Polarisedimenticolaceae bacterium]